ncbi:glycosyltransferase [Clostridium sp. YIM B02505]|uniref:Glycosyltransferase n=1 Tax=Clostridium yunnanense TaxID=2800325 RepID=A0ABS1EVK8_9CLOT|nr:glycosyltransferase [Clostridium yunnanense]MBK1813407.1 glycosyltransferase [Clostridium yunnanense]
MKNEVSLCMIVKDEESLLPICLNSIKDLVDEIIIVDTGSKDRTIDVAKSFSAKIYNFNWNSNFSEARNESLKHATKDLILIMDADEELYLEDKEKLRILLSGELKENAIYFFQGISYLGEKIDEGNITTSLNPRLFKNNRGIHYEGQIHNQLVYVNNEVNVIEASIKIHHYGYLNDRINLRKKRDRNIPILEEQIKRNSKDGFAYFNLGTEYYSLGNIDKTLECYYKAYEQFDCNLGYSSRLIIRIALVNYELKKFMKALEFIDIGVRYFEDYTDLYFIRSLIYKELKDNNMQLEALNKCIELGEAPVKFRYLSGTGTYAAYNELANLYLELKNYDKAYLCFVEVIKAKPDYIVPLYNIIHILKKWQIKEDEIRARVEELFYDYPRAYYIIAEAFFHEQYYEISLYYAEKCITSGIDSSNIIELRDRCVKEISKYKGLNEIDIISKGELEVDKMINEVSLCMIVKNEEEYLPRCLNSVKDIVNEIIVVDTGSTDRTVEIAKEFGSKVYFFQWNNNFSEARNESLKYATKDWILIIDADEEIYEEDQKLFKVLLNSKLDEYAIYNFQGVSYSGNSIDENNKTINLNPRLFKNNLGIHYEGAIHNQLIYNKKNYNVICEDVKIHHYGYLNERIISTDKRNRNLAILKDQFGKDPNDKFVCFNLGNEYAALGDLNKALELYYKAYDNFDANTGYSAMLIIRMVYLNYDMGRYTEALRIIEEGTRYYADCTDLYFLKSEVYKVLRKPILRIKALEKCIEIGDSPAQLKFFSGTGGFKAYYELGNIYLELRDFDTAYNYYVKAMQSEPGFITPIYDIVPMFRLLNIKIDEIRSTVEELGAATSLDYSILADAFFREGYYDVALECIEKCEKNSELIDAMKVLKGRCLVRTGKFKECISVDKVMEDSEGYIELQMCRTLSYVLMKDYNNANQLIQKINSFNMLDYSKKVVEVFNQLMNMLQGKTATIINKDENETSYMDIIIEICEIMLVIQRYDELSIAVNLANLVDNRFALLRLGKLYFRYGYIELAKKEVLRSIKELGVYDAEGLDILKV